MALIRWNPLNISSFLDEDWDLPTLPGLSRLGQGLNLYETENELVAEAAMPGIPEDKIDITVDSGVVRITGSQEEKKEETNARRHFMRSMAQTFNYSFRLPEGLIEDHEPHAKVEKGILTIRLKKAKKTEPKKVRVVAKESSK